MGILLYEQYEFPIWNSPSQATINAYVTEVKNFFVEKFNFYPYGEITTYDNRTVCYFSEKQDELPCFCFIHNCEDSQENIGTSFYNYPSFWLSPVLYDPIEERLIPQKSPTYTGGNYAPGMVRKSLQDFNFCNCIRAEFPLKRLVTVYIKLTDGRKIICFKTINKNTGLADLDSLAYNGCLYYTQIKRDEREDIWTWLILAKSPASSYISEIDNTLSYNTYNGGKYFHEVPYQYYNPRYFATSGGFIPSLNKQKDFLLKLSRFYLGDFYYIKNIYFFSKVLDFNYSGPVGTIVQIKDKKYIILQHSNGQNDFNNGTTSLEQKSINTISLITPIDIEEENNQQNSNNNEIEENNNNNSNEDNHEDIEITPSL